MIRKVVKVHVDSMTIKSMSRLRHVSLSRILQKTMKVQQALKRTEVYYHGYFGKGYIIRSRGIKADLFKIKALTKMPPL